MTPTALRRLTITYSKSDLVAVSVIAGVVAVWAAVAGGAFSLPALLACEAAFFAFYLTGSLFAALPALATGVLFDLPLRLLVGYGAVNTALFGLAWLSPLGVVVNFVIVLMLVLAVSFAAAERKLVRGNAASLLAITLCLVASTLWCQDSIQPRSIEPGDVVSFKPWVDGFYHAVHVRIFAESHGAASIEDFRLAGVPARPYHYGMYLLPAFIKQASAIDAYAAFAGVLAPVGVFFTGLGAYALFGSLWGAWPGLAAAVALLLLPDGAQQGMRNPFMSYHWLTQISPSATYGLALLAVAWLFVIKGCVQRSRFQLFTGWGFAAVVLVYKVHYVFASALLLLLVPAIFFQGLNARRRVVSVVAACFGYGIALGLGQKVPGVPLIRFDGSSVGEILRLIQAFAAPGLIRDYIAGHTGSQFSWATNLVFGVPYVLLAALGAFVPLLVVLIVRLRRRTHLLYVLFPVVLIVNFLVMFFGLALDFASSTPDELSHRPLMIVYFFAVSWVGAAACFTLSDWPRLRGLARPVLIPLAILLIAVPARFGPGVQQMWAMPRNSPVRLPKDLIRVAEYIRSHGGAKDVFQHSQFDRVYALAALSERRSFVAHTMTRMPFRGELVETRTAAIDHFMGLLNPKAISATAHAFGFRWFILERGDRVDWPPEVANRPVFEAGPFRVYEF